MQAQSDCTSANTATPAGQATCEAALETVSGDEQLVSTDQSTVSKDETALGQALAAASSATGSGGTPASSAAANSGSLSTAHVVADLTQRFHGQHRHWRRVGRVVQHGRRLEQRGRGFSYGRRLIGEHRHAAADRVGPGSDRHGGSQPDRSRAVAQCSHAHQPDQRDGRLGRNQRRRHRQRQLEHRDHHHHRHERLRSTGHARQFAGGVGEGRPVGCRGGRRCQRHDRRHGGAGGSGAVE